uniref:Ig-like domain-containing protein n=1 Tax=Amphiprion ocellaris TaxID=80972 RepID=A0A3Q1BQZ4_AMPOC
MNRVSLRKTSRSQSSIYSTWNKTLYKLKDEESSLEGRTVTLSCKYTKGDADYFFWYRQHPGKAPEFLISHLESGKISLNPVPGLSVIVRKQETKMDLKISSAAVSDSAVYYCAVRPTGDTLC